MRRMMVLGAALAALMAAPVAASTMSVQTFVTKADKLKKKGPFALLSGDLKLLMNQVKSDSGQLRAERLAAQKAGRTPAYCPPEKVQLTDKNILEAMNAVPPAQRAATTTRTALRAYFARRFPCRS